MRTSKFIIVDRRSAGRTVLDILQTSLRISRKKALRLLHDHHVRISGGVCGDPERRLKIGNHVQVCGTAVGGRQAAGGRRQAAVGGRQSAAESAHGIVVRHVDDHIVVVEKPAGLTTVRHADEKASFGPRAHKFLPPTLVDLLPGVLRATTGRLRAVHRIDKETSGLVVLARTAEAERHLGKQFRAHSVGRRYLALVRGQATDRRIESHLVRDRGDGRRGSAVGQTFGSARRGSPTPPGSSEAAGSGDPRRAGEGSSEAAGSGDPRRAGEAAGSGDPRRAGGAAGQHAVTHVRVVEALGDYTLVECRLETGRTHQLRIHLGETGTPLCGERVYDRPVHGQPAPDRSGAKRPLLHAAYLALDHPQTGKRLEWHADLPKDMKDLIFV